MSFRIALARVFGALWPSKPEKNILVLSEGDELSRFLFQSNEFSREKRIVKRLAFMPARDGTTSVYHTTGLLPNEIVDIARTHVTPYRGKPAYGWAEIQVQSVREIGLKTDFNNEPPRHVNITNWPVEKDRQMSLAQQLAAAASLWLVDELT